MLPLFLMMIFFWLAHGEMPAPSTQRDAAAKDLVGQASDERVICTHSAKDIITFLESLKKAIRENDKETIAHEMVAYPFTWIRLLRGKERFHATRTPDEFIRA